MEQKKLYAVDLETDNGNLILVVLQADSMDEALQKAREKAPGMLVTSVSEHTRTLI